MASTSTPNSRLNKKATEALAASVKLATEYDHTEATPIHIAVTLFEVNDEDYRLENNDPSSLFKSAVAKAGGETNLVHRELNKPLIRFTQQYLPPPTPELNSACNDVITKADMIRSKLYDLFIGPDHILLAVLEDEQVAAAVKAASVKADELTKAIKDMRRSKQTTLAEGNFENLRKYSTDLTALAAEGKIDPVIGRESEIRRVIRILCRRTKNNPVLIGEPGVGKTAIAEGLALRIINKDVPASLQARIFSLDLGALIAGTEYRGQHEERIKKILDEVSQSAENGPGAILFVDEMHLLVGGRMDAAQLFKPMLARGKLRCIGATTLAEYSKYIEKDAALERRFSQVIISEPTVPEALQILRGIREKYEVHHGVKILDSALVTATSLAHRYLTTRRLPDSAIDLVDECCSCVRAQRETRPEMIDNLERKRMELNIEIHALENEKDEDSVKKHEDALQALDDVDNELRSLLDKYHTERKTVDNIMLVKKRIDHLKTKAEEAERGEDIATASDIRYIAIPDLEKELKELEAQKLVEEESTTRMIEDTVTSEGIAEVVARWTGIPSSRLQSTEAEKLLMMEDALTKQVVGQPEAVSAVANAIRLSRSGLSNENRPIASFLFAGPSGTGKTLMAKTLATLMFDSPEAMIRIDATEYSEKHSVSRLIGSPPGYIGYDDGGQLTDYVRRKPYCIVLVDEIEKAAKEVVTVLLQVLDDGRLTDGHGRVVDFKNTIIIMTSNLGATHLTGTPGPVSARTKDLVMGAIKGHFAPEFINRIDDIIIYRALTKESMNDIIRIRLKEVQVRLDSKKVALDADDAAVRHLASIGYSPTYGARPLNRTIQQELLNPLAVMLLDQSIQQGETCRVTFDRLHNKLKLKPNHVKNEKGELVPAVEEMEVDPDPPVPEPVSGPKNKFKTALPEDVFRGIKFTEEEERWLLGGASRKGAERL